MGCQRPEALGQNLQKEQSMAELTASKEVEGSKMTGMEKN
jgi:hypothetical protein